MILVEWIQVAVFFMGEDFSYDEIDEQFGDEILELVIKYLIVKF